MTYIKISDCSEAYCGDVQRIRNEVHHIPHVADVLLETHVPELLDLAPDETSHPGQDAGLHQGGLGSSLGHISSVIPAQHILDPLRSQYQQNWN